ncbi:hypothetical protein ONZ45_g1280 [Pleurotus djamor]|nr:hypothetical protein ONZ45_g1280 [Pleurotus djamor]
MPSTTGKPVIKYAALYGDIEHEVLPVKSGNRVTLTYNLYYAGENDEDPTMSAEQAKFVKILKGLVAPGRSDFLPEGGWVGFPLRHDYAFGRDGRLENVKKNLKGVDVAFSRACDHLKINTNHVPTEAFHTYQYEDGLFDDYIAVRGAMEVCSKGSIPRNMQSEEPFDKNACSIYWLTPPRFERFGGPNIPYVTYGNEACLEFAYGSFYFHLNISPFTERQALAKANN